MNLARTARLLSSVILLTTVISAAAFTSAPQWALSQVLDSPAQEVPVSPPPPGDDIPTEPAPVDPTLPPYSPDQSPVQPFPDSCDRCPMVNITCNTSACPPGAKACSFPDKCAMSLTQEMCNLHGFSTGSYPADQFKNTQQCQTAWRNNETLDSFAENCCTIRHEYGHLCDPSTDEGNYRPAPCRERSAENVGNVCLDSVINTACSGPNLDTYQQAQCTAFCETAVFRAGMKAWHACMCPKMGDQPRPLNSEECCGCVNECNPDRVRSILPEACLRILPVYTEEFDEKVKNQCKGTSTGPGGCASNGGPSDFDPNACGKRCEPTGQWDLTIFNAFDKSVQTATNYNQWTSKYMTCDAVGTRLGGNFTSVGDRKTVTDIFSETNEFLVSLTHMYPYCREEGWKDYITDNPPKSCPPKDTSKKCTGTGASSYYNCVDSSK